MKPEHVNNDGIETLMLDAMTSGGSYVATGDTLVLRNLTFQPKMNRYALSIYRYERDVVMTESDVKKLLGRVRRNMLLFEKEFGKEMKWETRTRECGCLDLYPPPKTVPWRKTLLVPCWNHYKKTIAKRN